MKTPPSPPTTTAIDRAVTGVLIVLAALSAALGVSAASAVADECPNAGLRAQNNSTNLPDCRAYELVSNPFKEGFVPNSAGYTEDGVLAYTSGGNFVDNGLGALPNQYVATRTPTGWKSTAIGPSGPSYVTARSALPLALSADLRSSVWLMRRSDGPANVLDLYLRGPDGVFTRIGPSNNPATLPPAPPSPFASGPDVAPAGASADLSHVLFTLLPNYGYPGDTSTSTYSLYEYVGTGNDRPLLVGVDNTGHQISQGSTCPSGISADGRVVFFEPGCHATGIPAVWARINGVTSIEASASKCTRSPGDPGGACNALAAASFAGAANDGSRVFFTTSQQLVNDDTDQTDDLYACDIPPGTPAPVETANPCAALREISGLGSGAQVENVAQVSNDGSRVYFVAQGALAANPGANGLVAVAGYHNLYLWQQDAAHPTGKTTFVARLDTNDTGAPFPPQISANGRYLVLSTTNALVASGPQADTDYAADVYRYDSETGKMLRLSTATSGRDGNEPGFDATISGGIGSAVSADGDTVVFTSSEGLSPTDVNGVLDVYEWRAGRVWLASSGQPSPPAFVSASGADIFFTNSARLTPADGDTNPDLYDARVGGGFDFTVARACSGDECQGQLSTPPTTDTPQSDTPQQDDQDLVAPVFLLRTVSATERRRLAVTGRVALTVRANTPGVVSATATAMIAGRSLTVASTRQTMAKAGTTRLVLVLSNKARRQLKHAGRLTVRIMVEDSRVAASRSATLKLTHAKGGGRS